jgi:hypothetical protein
MRLLNVPTQRKSTSTTNNKSTSTTNNKGTSTTAMRKQYAHKPAPVCSRWAQPTTRA